MVQQQEVTVQVTHLPLSHDPSYALGNVQAQLKHWELITSDSVILGIIREGIAIDFHTAPSCLQPHPLCNLNLVQQEAVTGELSHLVSLGVISQTSYHPDKFVSGPPYGGNNMCWCRSPLIRRDAVHYTLYSDASLEGWGGTDITTHIGGRWTDAEMPHHINALELQAAYLTLQALGSEYTPHLGQYNCHYIY